MKNQLVSLIFVLLTTTTAMAQGNGGATASVWLDTFGGPQGAVIYPQYSWNVNTSAGSVSGYGFLEVAPHEPLFTNHLVVYTLAHTRWFSIHTETGGIPRRSLGFFQVGPRVNVQEVIPGLKQPLHHLFIAVLPRCLGIRPNNLLIAGATNHFRLSHGIEWSLESYRRFFLHRPDYSEYWFLVHPKKTKPVSFGVFVLRDGGRTAVSAGLRISR